MKRRNLLIVFGILAAVSMAFTGNLACSLLGIRTSEEYAHDVVHRDGAFEIRAYAPCLIATTESTGSFDATSSTSFNRLAGYIFGSNLTEEDIPMTMPVVRESSGTEIAMTTPVTREKRDGNWSMSFVLPSKYTLETLPRPVDERVRIESRPGVVIAAFRYAGVQRDGDLEKYAPALRAWARQRGYRPVAESRLAAYDPPWTVWFLRRNEVLLEVEEVDGATDVNDQA